MDFDSDQSLKEWAKDKPLSILQLDPADRAVLRIADISVNSCEVMSTTVKARNVLPIAIFMYTRERVNHSVEFVE
ncbi:hypothetical protein PGB90_000388 [Kerria lacca]